MNYYFDKTAVISIDGKIKRKRREWKTYLKKLSL